VENQKRYWNSEQQSLAKHICTEQEKIFYTEVKLNCFVWRVRKIAKK
jgi:hypothetical protein